MQHLAQLSAKYPLSDFEDDMVDFLESAVRSLGTPALAKVSLFRSSWYTSAN